MLHLGHVVALVIAVSTLSQLTSGQSTVDSELTTNDRCYNNDDYTLMFKALVETQKRLESLCRQQGTSSGRSCPSCNPQQTAPAKNGVLVQQHIGGTTFFNRSWEEFKIGFGNTSDNYWIGNERLHQLTKDGRYKLRVDLESKFNGKWYWAEYERFSVGGELSHYTLSVSDYSGNAGDGMTVDGVVGYNLNGAKFQTYDHYFIRRCFSTTLVGGFWYTGRGIYTCGHATINRQSPYFAWKSLPIGFRHRDHVALVQSRMTLLEK